MAKASVDLRSLARSQTRAGLRTLVGIMKNSENDSARVRAVELIFERGWGKAEQRIEERREVQVIVRHIVRGEIIGDRPLRVTNVTPQGADA